MELVKNYPWMKPLKVSEAYFRKWKSSQSENSFVFWSLNNRVINQKCYFDWAVNYYQIPFLEDMFFEQHLMTKKQWGKVQDLSDWNIELMPVALWKDTVFIGCVKPPLPEKQNFNFKHCFVLTSSVTLQTIWSFTKELSNVIEKEREATQSRLMTQTFYETQANSYSLKTTQTENVKEGGKVALSPDTPLKKDHPLDEPLVRQPSVQSLEKEKLQPVVKAKDNDTKNNSKVLKVYSSDLKISDPMEEKKPKNSNGIGIKAVLPEIEEERMPNLEDKTFPGRSPYQEENSLVMGSLQKESSDSDKKSSSQTPASGSPGKEKNNLVMGDFQKKNSVSGKNASTQVSASRETDTTDSEDTRTEITFSSAGVSWSNYNQQHYDKLWKQTQFVFCTSMILKVKGDKVYNNVWSGRIKVEKIDGEVANLKDYSLFKIIQKGHSYHGFVVDTPANKKFFKKIGWDTYPKHITAIPIKNEKQELKKVFAGLSTSPLSREKIKNIEKIISDFFRSHSRSVSQAA